MQLCTLAPCFSDKMQHREIPKKSFQRTAPPSVQVPYTLHSHWVTSFQRAGYNRVFLLDSLFAGYSELPASLQIQLAQIYGSSDGQLVVVVPSLSKQINGDDCGLYAIANMFEICQNGYDNVPEGELIWEFQPDDLRSHLISCFSSGHFSSFPRKDKKTPKEILSTTHVIPILCDCGLPNLYADMVGCDLCDAWHHKVCVGFENTALPQQWLCPQCKSA